MGAKGGVYHTWDGDMLETFKYACMYMPPDPDFFSSEYRL